MALTDISLSNAMVKQNAGLSLRTHASLRLPRQLPVRPLQPLQQLAQFARLQTTRSTTTTPRLQTSSFLMPKNVGKRKKRSVNMAYTDTSLSYVMVIQNAGLSLRTHASPRPPQPRPLQPRRPLAQFARPQASRSKLA